MGLASLKDTPCRLSCQRSYTHVRLKVERQSVVIYLVSLSNHFTTATQCTRKQLKIENSE